MLARISAIAGAILAMVLVVTLLGPRLHRPSPPVPVPPPAERLGAIPAEAGVFRTIPRGDSLARARRPGVPERRLTDRDRRRAYPGAPPVIPHALTAQELREQRCLNCHARGGYVARFETYAPPTPHPELTSCLQCHVPQHEVAPFRASDWRTVERPATGGAALAGAPPPIPHALQMRENCLACHGSPSAPPEIRTSHPERVNCRQCHVTREADGEYVRPAPADAAQEGAG